MLPLVSDGGAIERSGSALSHLNAVGRKDLGATLPSPLEDSLRQAATCKLHLQWGDLGGTCGVDFSFLSTVGFEKSQIDNVARIVKCYQ